MRSPALLLLALGGCGPPPPFGATAVELGVLPQAATIEGRDGGGSGRVFGRSVWTFGDTVLATADLAGRKWHSNSYSLTDDTDASDGVAPFVEPVDAAGAPQYLLAPTDDEAAFNDAHYGDACQTPPCGARWAVWPGPPLWDADRARALVFYGLIYAEPGDFNFHGVGQSLALWSDVAQAPTRPLLTPGAAHPTLLFVEGEPDWGVGAVVDGGWLYSFACDGSLSSGCALARVALADALTRAAWRFWDGSAWSADLGARARLFDGAPSMSTRYNAYLGLWTVSYAEPLGNHVVIRTAPALTGPWSAPRLLFEARRDPAGAYDANEHAEFASDGDRVLYFTFSRPNGVGWFGSELALVRVTLP